METKHNFQDIQSLNEKSPEEVNSIIILFLDKLLQDSYNQRDILYSIKLWIKFFGIMYIVSLLATITYLYNII